MRLLIAEDEEKMAAYLRRAMESAGHSVEHAADGATALRMAMEGQHDAIILDLNLPFRDGLSILKHLRAAGKTVPVLILSARAEADDRILGLNLGADDYLPKPFSLEELFARLETLLRQSPQEREEQFTVGDLVLDATAKKVSRAGKSITLPMREFQLLEFLVRRGGSVLSRAAILEHVWGYHFDPGTNIVEVYIQRLRRKVDDGHTQKLIHTVPGMGYRLSENS